MAPAPVIELIDSDDDDDGNAKTPVSKPLNTTTNPPNFVDLVEDSPTPTTTKFQKSSSPFVPVTPLSKLAHPPLLANSSSGDESIPDDDGGLEKGTCVKNIGACAGSDSGKDLVRSPKYAVLEREIDFDSWLDMDSNVCLHKGGEPNVHVEGKGLGKRSSMENGRAATDVEQNLKKRPKVVAKENCQEKERITATFNVEPLDSCSNFQSTCHLGNLKSTKTYDHRNHIQPSENHDCEKKIVRLEKGGAIHKPESGGDANTEKKQNKVNQAENRKKLSEEKRLMKEQERSRKAELKDETAKQKQLAKERKKLEKHKFSEKDIVAVIDPKVLSGSVGGPLLTMFSQKDLRSEIFANPFEKSIVLRIETPKDISQHATVKIDVQYILLIYGDAEEFCKCANDGSLMDHIASVRKHYPSYTICCLTNRLMSFINKREQQKYKQQKVASDWIRPPVEKLFAKLTTQFSNVHIRQCVDEAEVAEHVVGLTINLAKCHSRKKLTHLSVNANGCNVTKDCLYRSAIKKDSWLKALVSIPKVQPRHAITIGKKYPTMKSLLQVYMDPTKTVPEKELLLEDLPLEDGKKLGAKCSKSIYRVLMAKNGSIVTDDAVNGADNFSSQ
ncbi:crossover junction endonuclease EME1B-like isoform X2 [Chenopodium quinoa]|uniref:crossover junction endonuclease EME1B-like isoform X2 n=1 Tax=Chenopodium quinoa TaxID=63459 RepID=UPI000B782EE1|nr:crossover junction endonuclease EME1B-like isoform X2 [Chenopodium quinoa]